MKKFWHTHIHPHKKPLLIGIFLILTLFRVFLFLRTPLAGSAEVTSDDWNLLQHAWTLQHGEWLGAYQDSTLSFGIAFPFFAALCNILCIPFMLGVAMLYIGSILYFLHSWKTLLPSDPVRRILYLVFLYSPVMMTTYTAQRAWDLTLVPSLVLLLLALGYRVYQNRKGHLFSWVFLFGMVFTFFWYLRQTNYWILPLFLGFFIFVGHQMKKEQLFKRAVLLLIPVVMVAFTGLGISLLNAHYYDKFTVYTDTETDSTISPSFLDVTKDTLYTIFHMSANQMTDIGAHPGSGSQENLRFIETYTGSQIIYPNPAPLKLSGWAFPTEDSSNLELAVTDSAGQPLAYAEFENSEDVYMANMEYAASRVSRFTLKAAAEDISQLSLTIYINGEPVDRYPIELQSAEKDQYHLFLEEAGMKEDPALYTSQSAVKASQISLFLYKILGIPAMLLTVISYIGISFSLKSGNRIFQRWIFLTGIGLTALLSIILSCVRYPSLAGLDPAAYASGAWMFIHIFMALCIVWFFKPIRLGKKQK